MFYFNCILLRFTIHEIPILASYNNPKGIDIINMETGSGGVIKEEAIKTGLVNNKEYDFLINPLKMTEPN